MAKRYQMLWDCPSCGTRKLLGLTHRHCPNCGAAQDPKRRYFPNAGEEVAVEGHMYVGVDLACPACSSPNSAAANNCVNCGASLAGASAVALRDDQRPDAAGAFAVDSAKTAVAEHQTPEPAAPTAPAKKKLWGTEDVAEVNPVDLDHDASATVAEPPKKRRWPKVAGALATVAVVMALWTRDLTVTATEHTWLRAIDVERLTPRQETAWRDQVPSGAYSMSCHREVREHRQVATGESCQPVRKDLGDGTFTTEQECHTTYRTEEIYDDQCSFTIDRWLVARTEEARGQSVGYEPVWPQVRLGRTGNCVGCEREGARREEYVVTFAFENRTDKCSFRQTRWKAIGLGSELKAKARVVTGGLVCSSLE